VADEMLHTHSLSSSACATTCSSSRTCWSASTRRRIAPTPWRSTRRSSRSRS